MEWRATVKEIYHQRGARTRRGVRQGPGRVRRLDELRAKVREQCWCSARAGGDMPGAPGSARPHHRAQSGRVAAVARRSRARASNPNSRSAGGRGMPREAQPRRVRNNRRNSRRGPTSGRAAALIVDAIADQEKIEVSDDEVGGAGRADRDTQRRTRARTRGRALPQRGKSRRCSSSDAAREDARHVARTGAGGDRGRGQRGALGRRGERRIADFRLPAIPNWLEF